MIFEIFPCIPLGVICAFLILGIFRTVADLTGLAVTGLLGLPKEAVISLVLGYWRKDMALGTMAPFGLSAKQ